MKLQVRDVFISIFSNLNKPFQDELLELEELPGPFLVDNMKDEASNAYGAHPERLYIILDGKIVYQVMVLQIYVRTLMSPCNCAFSGWTWSYGLSS